MPDGFLTALAGATNVLFLLAGIYVYFALTRQIGARRHEEPEAGGEVRTFGIPDVVLALMLATLFVLNAATAVAHPGHQAALRPNDLIANALLSLALFVFVAAFVSIRGISVGTIAGWAKLGFVRTLATAAVLLLAAYPLIIVADLISQRVLGGRSGRQNIVELFTGSETLQQRVLIIILAVGIAPLVEEFVFRFFIYGVVKRYAGIFVALVVNSLLFAAVHAHVPSAAPLFVLAACFTLAYEWSGSILVNMTMHALFNSLTLTALAFPELLPQ
jgi:membrane protease YdiL (CAAX protease family)